MKTQPFDLNNISIASPCTMSWREMTGDDRTRHCSLCSLNVYNLSNMTSAEVERMFSGTDGRLCVRLLRRTDGTVITRDCPVGRRAYGKRIASIASVAFGAVLSLFSVSYAQKEDVPATEPSRIKIVRTASQIGKSSITGVIVDPNGAVVPGIKVRLLRNGKKVAPQQVSDAEGRFAFRGLSVGNYQIEILGEVGLRSVGVHAIDVAPNETTDLNIDIQFDGVTVLVGVVGETPLIDMTTNEQKKVYTREMLDRMPGRRPFE